MPVGRTDKWGATLQDSELSNLGCVGNLREKATNVFQCASHDSKPKMVKMKSEDDPRILSSTRLCFQSGVDEHPEAYATNTYSRPPQQGVHDVATDTSAETKKLEGKLDALANLVTQLAANQKPSFVARGCGVRSSNDHHTSVCPSSQQSGVDEHPEAYSVNPYSRPPRQQRQGT
ncbi:hypothetical protein Fmac_028760 [Flemingia macrophylla]|uniref:Uncharacterized protein n=1 Tax=Flemingia macrophylla TaxID=520843 RepID=A0ABD1L8I3_9FABA